MDIIKASETRYTCKAYDESKKLTSEQIKNICTLLKNSPSSVNSQPWHFFIIESAEAKNKILPGIMDFNQPKILKSSHTIIFCARNNVDDSYLKKLGDQEEQDKRFASPEKRAEQDQGRKRFVSLNSTSQESLTKWVEKQVYISLGTLLLGAGALGINATPIEGFDSKKIDEILNLKQLGLHSVVVVALGYKSDTDFNAKLNKSRLPEQETFTTL